MDDKIDKVVLLAFLLMPWVAVVIFWLVILAGRIFGELPPVNKIFVTNTNLSKSILLTVSLAVFIDMLVVIVYL